MYNGLMKFLREAFVVLVAGTIVSGVIVFANSSFSIPASVPGPTGVTVEDIYDKLSGISTSTKSFDPTVGTGTQNFHDLGQIFDLLTPIDPNTIASGTTIMGVAGVYDISGLDPANVATGTVYGTSSVGTMQ